MDVEGLLRFTGLNVEFNHAWDLKLVGHHYVTVLWKRNTRQCSFHTVMVLYFKLWFKIILSWIICRPT
jgi:hypothetical protein